MSLLTYCARRFVAGDRLDQALKVVARMQNEGFHTTLDQLGEEVKNPDEARAATEEYIGILRALKEHSLERHISVKLTQLGLAIDRELCAEHLERIARTAHEVAGGVTVDIEGSAYTSATHELVARVHARYPELGGAVQAMLTRTGEDVAELVRHGVSIRLCKGAYKEPPAIAYQRREEICAHYRALMERMLTSRLYHGIATHDETLIEAAKRFVDEHHIDRDAFEFQMLMGIRPALQRRLVNEGWNVRIYVPYGSHWLPYMLRRLRERKENVWFVMRNLCKG